MAQDLLRLASILDFSLSLESELDHNIVVEEVSGFDFLLELESTINPTLPISSEIELEERDPL